MECSKYSLKFEPNWKLVQEEPYINSFQKIYHLNFLHRAVQRLRLYHNNGWEIISMEKPIIAQHYHFMLCQRQKAGLSERAVPFKELRLKASKAWPKNHLYGRRGGHSSHVTRLSTSVFFGAECWVWSRGSAKWFYRFSRQPHRYPPKGLPVFLPSVYPSEIAMKLLVGCWTKPAWSGDVRREGLYIPTQHLCTTVKRLYWG